MHVAIDRFTFWLYIGRCKYVRCEAYFKKVMCITDISAKWCVIQTFQKTYISWGGRRYVELIKKYGLEISQPGIEPDKGLTWEMTKRRGDSEVHK